MVRYYEKAGNQLRECSELRPNHWVNISPPFNVVEIEMLAERLHIPMDFLTDSLDIDERSRFEIDDDATLIVINTPLLSQSRDEPTLYTTIPIGIILVPDYIVTIASYETPVIQSFLEMRIKHFDPCDRAMFLLKIMEQNVFHYLRCLKDINVRRGLVEQEVFESSRNQDLKRLLELEKSLVYFVTGLGSNAMLMMRMQRMDILGIKKDEEKYDLLSDVIIDNHQAQEMANIYSNILGSTMDTLASMISNNLNEVMHRLTVITVVLMVPTLVASFYGMNVPLPFQEQPYAFWVLLAIVLTMTIGLTWYFRNTRRV